MSYNLDVDIARVIELYRTGLSARMVAGLLNESNSRVVEVLRSNGVMRPKHERSAGPRKKPYDYGTKQCEACDKPYQATGRGQRFCKGCAPDMQLLKVHGITRADYDALVEAQNGTCGICRVPLSKLQKRGAHVDHDHSNGRVRGVICMACNLKLAVLDDAPWCAAAREYLARPGMAPRCDCVNLRRSLATRT